MSAINHIKGTTTSSPLKIICLNEKVQLFIKLLQIVNVMLLVTAVSYITSSSPPTNPELFEAILPYNETKSYNNNIHKKNDINPYPNWCPDAICAKRMHCKPCKRRYLFILSQGRSGSTTLKNMINLLPSIRIRGEFSRNRFFTPMAKVFSTFDMNSHNKSTIATATTTTTSDQQKQQFTHYEYKDNHLMCAAQSFIEELGKIKMKCFIVYPV